MRWMTGLLFAVYVAASAPLVAQSGAVAAPASMLVGSKSIWILGSDGRLSAYDTGNFRLRMRSAPIPRDARDHLWSTSLIGQAGLVLYTGAEGEAHLWDLRTASAKTFPWEMRGVSELGLPPAAAKGNDRTEGTGMVTRYDAPQLAFDAGDRRVFWFQNRMQVMQREGRGDVSQTGEFLCWTTDDGGRDARVLARIVLPQCKCGTGACEETCPQIGAWTPPSGVSTFFYLKKFIPGQLGESDQETDRYQLAGGEWKTSKLSTPAYRIGAVEHAYEVYRFLDARDHGETYIARIPDAGCCGWDNESNDLTYLVHEGKQATLFDEWARFDNRNYDVSFLTSNARFSPGGGEIAYTVVATLKAGQAIRLADQGKNNPEELRRIQGALAGMPRVEEVAAGDLSKPQFSLANAELIGWLDAHRLLVWKGGELYVADAADGRLTAIGLRADEAADVFLE